MSLSYTLKGVKYLQLLFPQTTIKDNGYIIIDFPRDFVNAYCYSMKIKSIRNTSVLFGTTLTTPDNTLALIRMSPFTYTNNTFFLVNYTKSYSGFRENYGGLLFNVLGQEKEVTDWIPMGITLPNSMNIEFLHPITYEPYTPSELDSSNWEIDIEVVLGEKPDTYVDGDMRINNYSLIV